MARAVNPPRIVRLHAAHRSHGCGNGADTAGGAGARAGRPAGGGGNILYQKFRHNIAGHIDGFARSDVFIVKTEVLSD